MEKLTGKQQKIDIVGWIDKNEYVGSDVSFEIDNVMKLENDIVLTLFDGNDKCNMRINTRMFNDLIDHFGDDPSDWVGRNVCIVFEKFKPKEGSKINEGVTTTFAWPEIVHIK